MSLHVPYRVVIIGWQDDSCVPPPSLLTIRYEFVSKKDPEVIYIYWGQSGEQ